MIELALAVPLLLLFLYGIIATGAYLAAEHSVVQAAADGARAAVPAADPPTAAVTQTDSSLSWLGQCGQNGITCTTTETPGACSTSVSTPCITVAVSYDYANHPLVPELPGFGMILPSTIKASTTTLLAPQP